MKIMNSKKSTVYKQTLQLYFCHKQLTIKFDKIKKKAVIDRTTDIKVSLNPTTKATYLKLSRQKYNIMLFIYDSLRANIKKGVNVTLFS